MELFFSEVTDYNLTKKELHQGFFMQDLLNISKQFFTRATFEEKFCFCQVFMTFYQCFQYSYSISPITLRQLSWHSCPLEITPQKMLRKRSVFVKLFDQNNCSTRTNNFTLNYVFSILALLFLLINVTGVIFHFITYEQQEGTEMTI